MSTTPHNHLDAIVAREHRQRWITDAFVAGLALLIMLLAALFA